MYDSDLADGVKAMATRIQCNSDQLMVFKVDTFPSLFRRDQAQPLRETRLVNEARYVVVIPEGKFLFVLRPSRRRNFDF